MRSIAVLLLPFVAASAHASDGVVEINQTCAVQTGCFAGDTAGFPVTISASGGYRLTSNLVLPNENTSAINVTGSDVSIDLNSFVIQGPVVCSGFPVACTPRSGAGFGIFAAGLTPAGVSVRNGSVRGVGANGLHLGTQAVVTQVRSHSNGSSGITTGYASTVSESSAYDNGDTGIIAGTGSAVSHNVVFNNGTYGIFAYGGSTITDNSVAANRLDGILTEGGCKVTGNTSRQNSRFGLGLNGSAYSGNVVSDNIAGTVDGGVDLGSNSCNGTPSCP